jgi:DNA-binding response OmpR family regulator
MAKRVLVVEDEQDHRELLKLIFSVHGYEVDTASSANEAVGIIDNRHPDVMVLDVMLPDVDGWTFCEQVKHEEDSPYLPILMLSASAYMQVKFEGSCADDMLTKPFDEKVLLSKIRHLLGE